MASRGTSAVSSTRSALKPGRPGAFDAGGSDSLVGRNVDAIETRAIRPCGLSKYAGARALRWVSPMPAYGMPASLSHREVSRMPSRPQSMLWLFARPTTEIPIALRSRATSGTDAFVQSPFHEYGAPENARG